MGSPFTLPYSHEAVFTEMHTGFYGIHMPNEDNLIHLLGSPERGLFFWTPFFLLALPGYYFLFRRSRAMFSLCYWCPLLHVICLSGYYTMEAGSTLGSRFLAPILPLLILPAGIAASKMPRLALLLGVLSIAEIGTATLIAVQMPIGNENPLFSFYIPQLFAGNVNTELGQAIGLSSPWSVLPVAFIALAGLIYGWKHIVKWRHCEQR